jgi:S-methylmethionine-dependent homocysteine/selenocysteine methylase
MSAAEAERYHGAQAATFRDADADLVTAITMTYPAEAIGDARRPGGGRQPVVISFTVETDGRLPERRHVASGGSRRSTRRPATPRVLMINCAHPTHFTTALSAAPGRAHPGAPCQRLH